MQNDDSKAVLPCPVGTTKAGIPQAGVVPQAGAPQADAPQADAPQADARQADAPEADAGSKAVPKRRRKKRSRRRLFEPCAPLHPHDAQPEIEALADVPRILVSAQAYRQMQVYVDIAPQEVSWIGPVTLLPNKERFIGDFLIEEAVLIEQECGPAHTKLLGSGLGKFSNQLRNSGQQGTDKANRLRFWGHSHVRFPIMPSAKDDFQMSRFGQYGGNFHFAIRGIFNKFGDGKFDLYHYQRQLAIHDLPWAVVDPLTLEVLLSPSPDSRNFLSLLSGPQLPQIPPELIASAELRAQITAEYKAKVTETIISREPTLAELKKGEGRHAQPDQHNPV